MKTQGFGDLSFPDNLAPLKPGLTSTSARGWLLAVLQTLERGQIVPGYLSQAFRNSIILHNLAQQQYGPALALIIPEKN
jgi:hypothetical protein